MTFFFVFQNVFKRPSRRNCKTSSWRCLANMSWGRIAKTSCKHVLKISWKMKNCYVENVFKTSSRSLEKQEMFAESGLKEDLLRRVSDNCYKKIFFTLLRAKMGKRKAHCKPQNCQTSIMEHFTLKGPLYMFNSVLITPLQ